MTVWRPIPLSFPGKSCPVIGSFWPIGNQSSLPCDSLRVKCFTNWWIRYNVREDGMQIGFPLQ